MTGRGSRREEQWWETGELLRRSVADAGALRERLAELELSDDQRRFLLDLVDGRADA